MAVVEFSYGESRIEAARKAGIRFNVLPRLGIAEGIDMARRIFTRCRFDESKCAE